MAAAEAALLRKKATLLREAMRRSEAVREQAVASVGGRMAAVDAAVRPAQERTRNACILHDNVARSLQAVQEIVRQFDLVREAEPVISTGPSIGISAYIETVDKLRGAKDFFTTKIRCKAGDDVLRRVNELLPKAAVVLENEFSRLLSKCSKPVELELLFNFVPSHSSADDPLNPVALPTLVDSRYMPLLSKLVQKSVELGRHNQVLKVYRDIRSSTLELTLKQLGVEYVTVEEVETVQAENLSAKVDQWIQCLRIAVILLNSDHIREGVNSFLLVAEANKSEQGFMCCPCLKCKNEKDYSCSRDIKSHLLRFGFMSSYNVWTKHGEEGVMMEDGDEEEDNDDQYRSMFSECDDTAMDDNEEEGGEEQASDDPVDDDLRRAISDARRDCGTDKERLQFDKMLEDHHKLLYPGCEDGQRKLGSILELLKWKAEVGVTDSGFEKLMIILKKLFPRNNELPVTYEAKKLVCPLGLDVRRYMHALMTVSSTAVRSTRI
ncbi:hypothetical protein QYE76_008672 [Lolium multiflorum]|uniref:Transposase-associated domain-containing protein n=1 Tax=Lolium multiflorum TaxID=4521 RepID=A0AAD8TQI6_LOLMU|nr:hypothetical protein QYE76_008672 [Lolium multiflorum]